MKVCRICGKTKPLREFYSRSATLHRTECKDCIRDARHKERLTGRPKALRRTRYAEDEIFRQATLARQNDYAAKNRQREAKRAKQWRCEHPKKLRELNVAYYAANRDKVLEQKREYGRLNPQKIAIVSSRKKARRRGAQEAPLTAEQWAARLEEFGHHCAYCWASNVKLTQDHLIPISKGGAHSIENIVPACAPCNARKYNRTMMEVLRLVK